MTTKLLKKIVKVISAEGIDESIIYHSLARAIELVLIKQNNFDETAVVKVELEDGVYQAYRVFNVVADDLVSDESQIGISDAIAYEESLNIGDTLQLTLDSTESRVGAHQARQIMHRLMKDAERAMKVVEYEKMTGSVVQGTVKKLKDGVIFDYNDVEGHIKRSNDT